MSQPDTGYQEFSAQGADGRVHAVDARADALIDPSPHRTRCGQPVFEVYNTGLGITCPACADGQGRSGSSRSR